MTEKKSILPPIKKKHTSQPVSTKVIDVSEKKSYSELLKDPRWQKCRLLVLQRDKFTCKFCKDKETTLHVHHKEYKYGAYPWDYPLTNFLTLCEHCHKLASDLIDNKWPKHVVHDFSIVKYIKPEYTVLAVKREGSIMLCVYDKDRNMEQSIQLGPRIWERFLPLIKSFVKNG